MEGKQALKAFELRWRLPQILCSMVEKLVFFVLISLFAEVPSFSSNLVSFLSL